jgi:catechol 2,3-dioxygenase-like lactoylglutathione lyase family enzyme
LHALFRDSVRLLVAASPPSAFEELRHDDCHRIVMLDHTGIVVTDLANARRFYDAIAKPLGLGTVDNGPDAFLLGRSAKEPIPYLWIGTLRPSYWVEGSRAGLNQAHIAFVAPSKEAVDEFHRVALAAGGRDNGAPGPRSGAGDYYGAFVLDPDGNNIEACMRGTASRQ